jgi:hypothetical protein
MKQETLEEAAERLYPKNIESIMDGYHDSNSYQRESFIKGYKLAQERSHSDEDLENAFFNGWIYAKDIKYTYKFPEAKKEWFETFKKK